MAFGYWRGEPGRSNYVYKNKEYTPGNFSRMVEALEEHTGENYDHYLDEDPVVVIEHWRRLPKRDPSHKKGLRHKARKISPLKQKLTPSPRLAAIIGPAKVTRGQAMKKIWIVIKRRKLQLPGGRVAINEILRPLFGNKRVVKITEIPGPVSKNLS